MIKTCDSVRLKATEARRLTEKSAKTVVIDPYLTMIYTAIKFAAEMGETSIRFNVYDLTGYKVLPTGVEKALRSQLRKDGYEIESHARSDPGHPRSTGHYETINW